MHFASCFGARMGFTVLSGIPTLFSLRSGFPNFSADLAKQRRKNSWGGFEFSKNQRAPSANQWHSPWQEGPRSPSNVPCLQTSSTAVARWWSISHGTEGKEAGCHILQGKARWFLWHAPKQNGTHPPLAPSKAAALGRGDATAAARPTEGPPPADKGPEGNDAASHVPIPTELAVAPMRAPLEPGSPDPLPPVPPWDLAAPTDPAGPPPVTDS